MPSQFLIMAGGTGGHVYPALATAQLLKSKGHKIDWMGSSQGMEESVISKEGLAFHGLSIKGLRGKGRLAWILAPFKLLYAVLQALKVMREVKPDCVLGMGGFASGPGGIAAKLMGVPLIIHEQNAVAGMTNRYLSKVADVVLEAFPNAFAQTVGAVLTGNPVRDEICQLYYRPDSKIDSSRQVRLLVLGGSLGAQKLNECLPEALALLDVEVRPEVRHQTGKDKYDAAMACYDKAGVEVDLRPYIDDMRAAYEWADIVICRAGALTISELCVAGLGAILIPYPFAVDDHQSANAQSMESAGAAWMVEQGKLTATLLAEMLAPLLNKPSRIERLGMAARELGQPESTRLVAEICERAVYA